MPYCISCGKYVPEGRETCDDCAAKRGLASPSGGSQLIGRMGRLKGASVYTEPAASTTYAPAPEPFPEPEPTPYPSFPPDYTTPAREPEPAPYPPYTPDYAPPTREPVRPSRPKSGSISRMGQIKVYFGKCFRIFVNEKQWKNLISAFIIVLIISFVTGEDMFFKYGDTKNGAFATICACIWIGLFNSIQSICRERGIIKKEHHTGLHISSYILAHVFYEAVICAAETLIVFIVVLIKNAGHLPPEGLILWMPIDLYFILFLVTFGSDMLAMLISCIVKSPNTAMTIMPFVLIIQLVMSGAVFTLHGPAETVANFTLSKWGLDGVLAVSCTEDEVWDSAEVFLTRQRVPEDELQDLQEDLMTHRIDQDEYDRKIHKKIAPALDAIEPKAGTLFKAEGILIGYSILYILIAIIALKQVDKDKR